MGGGAGDQAGAAARPDHAVRRARQVEAVQQHGDVLPARPSDQLPSVQDPAGSFVDVEQLSYYVWLNAEKTPAYRGKTLYLFLAEGVDEMLAIPIGSAGRVSLRVAAGQLVGRTRDDGALARLPSSRPAGQPIEAIITRT
jgi:hypothetical protein